MNTKEKPLITIRIKPEFKDSPLWLHIRKISEEVRNWPESKQRARITLRHVPS